MQILSIRKGFEGFKLKFEPFERGSKHLNANSNHSKGVRSIPMQIPPKGIRIIRMQIRTTRKRLEAFECKFEAFKRDSKHSNVNSNHWLGIRSNRMQIQMIQKGF